MTGSAGTSRTYDVVLLVEQPLSRQDAIQVRGLHEQAPDPVRYHVLLPVEDAAARVESVSRKSRLHIIRARPAAITAALSRPR